MPHELLYLSLPAAVRRMKSHRIVLFVWSLACAILTGYVFLTYLIIDLALPLPDPSQDGMLFLALAFTWISTVMFGLYIVTHRPLPFTSSRRVTNWLFVISFSASLVCTISAWTAHKWVIPY